MLYYISKSISAGDAGMSPAIICLVITVYAEVTEASRSYILTKF